MHTHVDVHSNKERCVVRTWIHGGFSRDSISSIVLESRVLVLRTHKLYHVVLQYSEYENVQYRLPGTGVLVAYF